MYASMLDRCVLFHFDFYLKKNSVILQVGVFPEFSGDKFENFTTLAERLRADYEFGHTLDAKLLPRGDSSAAGPLVRLFKPFDELFVDSQARGHPFYLQHFDPCVSLCTSFHNLNTMCLQEFDVDALVKFVEETSTPTVTFFNKDPKHHPFVIKFFNSVNAKVISTFFT